MKKEYCITPLPPWEYPDARIWACTFTLKNPFPLPKGLSAPSPQIASFTFASYKSSSIGPYDELLVFIVVERGGKIGLYTPLVYVTTDEAYLGGRDVWGFPKRMGEFSFYQKGNFTRCQLLKNGKCLVSMEIEETGDAETIPYQTANYYVLKRIIDPEGKWVKRQLIEMEPPLKWKKIREGKIRSLNIYSTELEDFEALLPEQILTANTAVLDMKFVFGKIVEEWNE